MFVEIGFGGFERGLTGVIGFLAVCVSRGISGDGVWFPQLVIVSDALVASSSFTKTGN